MDGINNENLLIMNVTQRQMMNVIKSVPTAVLTKMLILIYYSSYSLHYLFNEYKVSRYFRPFLIQLIKHN